MPPLIRLATRADLPAINDIYNDEILHGIATFDIDPWTLGQRRAWLRETQHPHAVIVAVDDSEVIGFGCLRPFRAKAAYRFTAENSVYIHRAHRGRGIGAIILTRLIEIARDNGFHSIIAGVTRDNPASDRLHLGHGFVPVGTEREVGYKFERWLDVTWYQLML